MHRKGRERSRPFLRARQQVHGRGEADGADRDRVAGVAADREQDDGDRAGDDDGDPGGAGKRHGRYFGRDARR